MSHPREVEVELYTPHRAQLLLHEHIQTSGDIKKRTRFRVAACGRRWGKTLAGINEMLQYALEIPDSLILWVAPTHRQAKIPFRAVRKAFRKTGLFGDVSKTDLRIELINDSVLEFRTGNDPDNLRGEGVRQLFIDEAAYLPRNVWEEVLRASLSDTGGGAVLISTPKGKNYYHELFARGRDPEYPDWSCFTFPTSSNIYIPQSEIENAQRELPELVFRQEYLAEFLDDGAGVFRNIRGCLKGNSLGRPQPGWRYTMGIDLAKHQDFTVIVVLDKQNHLVDFRRFNKIDWPFQKRQIAEYAKKWNNARITLDASGVGDPIYDDLRRAGLSVTGFKFTNQSKKDLIESLVVDMEQGRISYPETPETIVMLDELEIFGYEMTRAGNVTYNAPQGYHDDCVIALALANWGSREPVVTQRDFQDAALF